MRYRLLLYYKNPAGREQVHELLSTLDSHNIEIEGDASTLTSAVATANRAQISLGGIYNSVEYDPEYPNALQLIAHDEGAAIVLYLAGIGTEIVDTTDCYLATTDKFAEIDQFTMGAIAILGSDSVEQLGRDKLLSAPTLAVHERDETIALIAGLSSQSGQIERVESYLTGHLPDGELRDPIELDAIPEPDWMDESGFLAAVGDWNRDAPISFKNPPAGRYKQLLQDSDASIRAEACWAYVNSHLNADTEQVEAVIQTLIDECFDDPDSSVRLEAVRGVRRLETETIESPDIEAIKNRAFADESATVRVEAIETLAEYKSHHVSREQAIKWFQQIYETDTAVEPRCKALLKFGIQDGLPLVFDGLRSDEAEIRHTAATVLGSRVALLNHGRNYPDSDEGLHARKSEIIDLLGHHDSEVREAAIEALSEVGGDDVVSELCELLGTVDANQRASAATALGYTQDPRAVEPLIKCLEDPSYEVRSKAVGALGHIHESHPEALQEAVEPLRSLLEAGEDELTQSYGGLVTLRESIIQTLEQIDDDSSFDTTSWL